VQEVDDAVGPHARFAHRMADEGGLQPGEEGKHGWSG
jgi:hypothetical protein